MPPPLETSDTGTSVQHGMLGVGVLYCPHPLCPPLPQAGEGERAAERTAVRPYTPRPQRGRGAGGEGEKVCPLPPVRMRNLTDARLGSPREAGVEPYGRAAWFPSRSGGNLKEGGDSRLQHAPACDECTLVGANGCSPYDQKFSVVKGLSWFEFSVSRVKFEDVVEVWVRVGFLGGGFAQSLAWLRI
jgi:hypothetical protein